MPPLGALWNSQVELELRELTGVVEAWRPSEPVVAEVPAPLTERPGWAVPLVLAALREASEPLTVMQVVRAIERGSGRRVNKDTLRYVLQRSRAAQAGEIIRIVGKPYDRYALASQP